MEGTLPEGLRPSQPVGGLSPACVWGGRHGVAHFSLAVAMTSKKLWGFLSIYFHVW